GPTTGLPGLDFLTKPMLFELGGTLTSEYVQGIRGNVDMIVSTQGAFLLSGDIEVTAGGVGITLVKAKMLVDLSDLIFSDTGVPSGARMAILIDLPEDPAILTIRGSLSFEITTALNLDGEEVPAIRFVINGGLDLNAFVTTFSLEGQIAISAIG